MRFQLFVARVWRELFSILGIEEIKSWRREILLKRFAMKLREIGLPQSGQILVEDALIVTFVLLVSVLTLAVFGFTISLNL